MSSLLNNLLLSFENQTNQLRRINKVYSEEYYLLDHSINDTKVECFISGSTKNVYSVHITRENGKLWCDCPDMKNYSNKYNIICKHCCFVILKIAKLFNTECIQNKQLSEDNINVLINRLQSVSTLDCIDTQLSSIYNKLKLESTSDNLVSTKFDIKYKEIIEEDDCPICYDPLINTDVKSCPECHNFIHTNCIKKWLESKQTCVLCRSPEWKHFLSINKTNNKTNYININSN